MSASSSMPSTLRWHQAGGQLRFGDLPAPDPVAAIALDGPTIARLFFRHDPPRPAELEHAIDVIEEALMAIAPRLAQVQRFVTNDAVLRRLPGAQPGQILTTAQVEALFQRLASASLGHPSAAAGLPSGPQAAATLLLLRETMHHLGVRELQFEAD